MPRIATGHLVARVQPPLSRLVLACAGAWALCVGSTASWADEPSPSPAAPPAAGSPQAAPSAGKSLRQVVQELRRSSRAIQSKQNEQEIASAAIERAQGAFEPTLNASASAGEQKQRSTPEEDLARYQLGNQTGLYDRRGQDYSAGVSVLARTGTKLEFKASLSEFVTNISQNLRQNDDYDRRASYGLTLTQPLARDAGPEVTLAKLRVAELEHAAATQGGLDAESSAVAEASMGYLDLVYAQERVAISIERVQMGKRVLAEAKARVRQGRAAESEVWEVENSLARYESALSEALQQRLERANRLRTLLNTGASDGAAELKASDPLPPPRTVVPSVPQGVQLAKDNRSDLRGKLLALERESVQVTFAKNQMQPRLDLILGAAYGGLDTQRTRALNPHYMYQFPTWSVGLQFMMPLGDNQQASADLRTAHARREDARQAIQALESAIANDIDTSVGLIASAMRRWQLASEVAQREQRQLELDRRRMTEGRGALREVLVSEERSCVARLQMLEQQTQLAKADVLLEAAQGTLLQRFAQ